MLTTKTDTVSARGWSKAQILGCVETAIDLNATEVTLYAETDGVALKCSRAVEDALEPVIPPPRAEEVSDAEISAALLRIELTAQEVFDNPYHALHDAMQHLAAPARWLVTEDKADAAAFFGFTEPKDVLFGLRVIEVRDLFEDKLVVVASPTTLLLHATSGVVIDLGV
jgi:hypothetical protein